MGPEKMQRWQDLAAQAGVEKDSTKLIALVDEINRILLEKETRDISNLPAKRKEA
jgi:hypothetical protein